MANPIEDVFIERGKLITLDVSTPFLPNDPAKVWFIKKGSINLSVTKVVSNEAVGKISDFITLFRGQAFFGIALREYNSMCFIADPEEVSTLYELSVSELRKWAENDDKKGLVLDDFVRNWITSLYKGLEKEGPKPEVDHNLRVGFAKDVEKNQVLSTKHNVVWFEASDNKALIFNDLAEINNNEKNIWLPISRYGFIRSSEDSRIVAEKPEPVIFKEECWNGLKVFHDLVLSLELITFNNKEKEERERLINKHLNEDAEMSSIFQQATSILSDDKEQAMFFGELSTKSRFYNTCSIVANYMDIKLKMPADLDSSEDPLEEISRYSSLRYREIMLDDDWYKLDGGAFLGFYGEEKLPIALIPDKKGYSAWDPEIKERRRITSDNVYEYHNYGYMFYKPLPSEKIGLKELFKYIFLKDKSDYYWALLMALVVTLLGMLAPILTAIIFDIVIPGAIRDQLIYVGFGLGMAAMGTFLFNITKSISLLRIEGKMDQQLQAGVWDRLLNLPVSFFSEFTSGDLAMRSLSVSQIRKLLSGVVLSTILAGVFSSLNLLLLFYYSASMATIAVILVFLQISVNYIVGKMQVNKQSKVLESSGKMAGLVLQLLTGINKFRVGGTERRAFNHWMKQLLPMKELGIDLKKLQNFQSIFNRHYALFTMMIIFIMMIKNPSGEIMSIGAFLSFSAAYGIFAGAMLQLSNALITTLRIIPLYERTRPILEGIPENTSIKEAPEQLSGSIELNDVTFRYDNDSPNVLTDLSINIKKGEYIALVGPSGSGKSTIIRLLLGFYEANSGSIYYDGQDLAHLDARMVRKKIGVVLQDGSLTSGSIFRNIIGSSNTLSINDAWEAAKAAAFDQDIKNMPMGMHTIVNESGGTISGGQRQRLMIARALVHRPNILIFDEATSALDNHTQAIVSESLEKLNVTRIVVAHRLSTIINADNIYYLENGEVVEKGNFEELMEKEGRFYELAARQIE